MRILFRALFLCLGISGAVALAKADADGAKLRQEMQRLRGYGPERFPGIRQVSWLSLEGDDSGLNS